MRPKCACGNLAEQKGTDRYGKTRYRSRCTNCRKTGQRYKKDHCERCGFVAEDSVQLDVDHIDNNPSNNDTLNLQTLCANCHRLKTKLNNDWKK